MSTYIYKALLFPLVSEGCLLPFDRNLVLSSASITMSSSVSTVLPVGAGYGVVVGIGFFFTAVMIGISMLQV